jgi:hypothetical protein
MSETCGGAGRGLRMLYRLPSILIESSLPDDRCLSRPARNTGEDARGPEREVVRESVRDLGFELKSLVC